MTLTLTHQAPSGATTTLSIDLLALMGEAGQAAPAIAAPIPAPAQVLTPRQERKAQRAAASAAQVAAHDAIAAAGGTSDKALAKAAKKAANQAATAAIRAAEQAGDIAQAVALCEARGWVDMAARILERAAAAKAQATSNLTSQATIPAASQAAQADAYAAQVLLAQGAPKAPAKAGKGRSAKERCAVHNVFLRKDGTCSKCQPAQAPAAPAPAAPVQPVLPVQAPNAIPEGFTEGDLAIYWGQLAQDGWTDVLTAALDTCRAQVMNMGQPTHVRNVWALRLGTLRNILGIG